MRQHNLLQNFHLLFFQNFSKYKNWSPRKMEIRTLFSSTLKPKTAWQRAEFQLLSNAVLMRPIFVCLPRVPLSISRLGSPKPEIRQMRVLYENFSSGMKRGKKYNKNWGETDVDSYRCEEKIFWIILIRNFFFIDNKE